MQSRSTRSQATTLAWVYRDFSNEYTGISNTDIWNTDIPVRKLSRTDISHICIQCLQNFKYPQAPPVPVYPKPSLVPAPAEADAERLHRRVRAPTGRRRLFPRGTDWQPPVVLALQVSLEDVEDAVVHEVRIQHRSPMAKTTNLCWA